MIYELAFIKSALKEWKKLDATTRSQFKDKLEERLKNPCVPSSKLYGKNNPYKIKLRAFGYRLVYEVREDELLVVVIAVGKRDKDAVYRAAEKR